MVNFFPVCKVWGSQKPGSDFSLAAAILPFSLLLLSSLIMCWKRLLTLLNSCFHLSLFQEMTWNKRFTTFKTIEGGFSCPSHFLTQLYDDGMSVMHWHKTHRQRATQEALSLPHRASPSHPQLAWDTCHLPGYTHLNGSLATKLCPKAKPLNGNKHFVWIATISILSYASLVWVVTGFSPSLQVTVCSLLT